MARITVGDHEFTYERLARSRSENVYEVVLVAESPSGEVSLREFELDATVRDELTTDRVEAALADWQGRNPDLTVERFVVRESTRCGFGESLGTVGDSDSADATTRRSPTSADGSGDRSETPLYRGGAAPTDDVGFGDVDVEEGEAVEFHVAGPSTSVYGTERGTVVGVKSGTDDHRLLIVETDSGTKRVREDWVVSESDGESPEAGD